MRRGLRLLAAMSIGALIQYLLDPQKGRTRRARLSDQGKARWRDLKEALGRRARYERGRLKGVAHEVAAMGTEDSDGTQPVDDGLILQRIQSQILGPARSEVADLEVHVEEGVVVLSGRVSGPAKPRLLGQIHNVTGVREIRDQTVPAS
jgi:osmotically-inducible protein OsmY